MNQSTDKVLHPCSFDIPNLSLEIKSAVVSEDLTECSWMFVGSSVLEMRSVFPPATLLVLFFPYKSQGCLCVIQKVRSISVSYKKQQLFETSFFLLSGISVALKASPLKKLKFPNK